MSPPPTYRAEIRFSYKEKFCEGKISRSCWYFSVCKNFEKGKKGNGCIFLSLSKYTDNSKRGKSRNFFYFIYFFKNLTPLKSTLNCNCPIQNFGHESKCKFLVRQSKVFFAFDAWMTSLPPSMWPHEGILMEAWPSTRSSSFIHDLLCFLLSDDFTSPLLLSFGWLRFTFTSSKHVRRGWKIDGGLTVHTIFLLSPRSGE